MIYTAIVFVLLVTGPEPIEVGPFISADDCEAGAAVFQHIAAREHVLPVAHVCVGKLPESDEPRRDA